MQFLISDVQNNKYASSQKIIEIFLRSQNLLHEGKIEIETTTVTAHQE